MAVRHASSSKSTFGGGTQLDDPGWFGYFCPACRRIAFVRSPKGLPAVLEVREQGEELTCPSSTSSAS
jgi:hypothetical protein